MKKNFLVFLLAAVVMSWGLYAEKVTLVTGDWEPYTSQAMKGNGFFTEIVTAVFKEMGDEPVYEFLPWKRCETDVLDGKAFAAFPYIVTDERKKSYDFSDVVAKSTGKFFYSKNKIKSDIKWEKFADLKAYKIGGTLGYWYEKDFKEAGLNVEYAPKDENSFQKLGLGRVDIVAADELVGWQLINKLMPKDAANFDTLDKPLNSSDLRLMISKKYPNSAAITEKFNGALKKIKEKGVYKEILKKYNIKE